MSITGVVVPVATVTLFVVPLTLVTVPTPAGVAHVPSPLQNVVPLAPEPELRFDTDKFPVTPVDNGSPVALVKVALVGVPSMGVTKVGEVLYTNTPVPVSLLITPANCALVVLANCDKGLATFPSNASNVAEISNTGVVPPVDVTLLVVPLTEVTVPPPAGVAHVPSPRQKVELLALVPLLRFVTGKFPVTPVVNGSPVALVKTAAVGVPRAGVVNVGEVRVGLVLYTITPVPLSSLTTVASCADVVAALF
jgi:hypothetical protein